MILKFNQEAPLLEGDITKKKGRWENKGISEGTVPPPPYAIYDTTDNLWIGDDHGPRVFDDWFLARAAAQVTGVRIGYHPLRLEARHYPGGPARKRDEVANKMDGETALRLIEDGGAL